VFAESRTWTQAATGKTITGELQRVEGGQIRILRDGAGAVDVPLAMLAEEDRKYVAAWQAKSALPTGPVQLTLAETHLCCGGCRDAVVAAAAPLPVNVLAFDYGWTTQHLADLGVRRVSLGGALARKAYAEAMHAAKGWLDTGALTDVAAQPRMPFGSVFG
jgi:hypothetical protein